MKIIPISLRFLSNGEHLLFHGRFIEIVNSHISVKSKVNDMFGQYLDVYAKENGAFLKRRTSEAKVKREVIDKRRREIFGAMTEIINANTKHFDDDIKIPAAKLKKMFDGFGNIGKKSINERAAYYRSLVRNLEEKLPAEMIVVGINRWLVRLKELNEEYEEYKEEYFVEQGKKSVVVMKDARKNLDCIYGKMKWRIEAAAEIEGVAKYENFIKMLNLLVAEYKSGDK